MLLCVCNQFVIQLVLRLFLTGRISVGHLFHIVIVKLTWRQMFLRKLQFDTHTFPERSELVPVKVTCVVKERIKK